MIDSAKDLGSPETVLESLKLESTSATLALGILCGGMLRLALVTSRFSGRALEPQPTA